MGDPARHLVLVGLMGVGKSTVGRRLAKELARPFADVDEQVELRAGITIPTMFEREGERAFRRIETEVVADLLARPHPLVVAAGGGLVTEPANRAALAESGAFVVWLRASAEFLARRTDPTHRPLLAAAGTDPGHGGGSATLVPHASRRRSPASSPSARRCTSRWPTRRSTSSRSTRVTTSPSGRSPATSPRWWAGPPRSAGERAVIRAGATTVTVEAGGGHYPVVVGPGVRGLLADMLAPAVRRVAVVTQPGIGVTVDPGREHEVFPVGEGEQAKSLATVEDLCRAWSRWGLTRSDHVVAVGGGVVTDTAGFAAAVYHRGVGVTHVPTTLLGMVDAAIGGKTGVNLPEGKNLVGAFWQPDAVLCDTETLATLPEREQASGRGEMAKYHFLTGDDLLGLPLGERVAACVRIKAAVVAADEREDVTSRRGRATLNYGHTLAHALETAGDYDLRHGEAVAVGLVYAAELAHHLGRIDRSRVDEHRRVVEAYGLRPGLPEAADTAELLALMARDKKAVDGLTFVLDGPDGVEVVPGVDPGAAAVALDALAGRS